VKTSDVIVLVVLAVIVGIVGGHLLANQTRLAAQVAAQDRRLTALEAERAERLARKAITQKAVGFGARILEKITFGWIKFS